MTASMICIGVLFCNVGFLRASMPATGVLCSMHWFENGRRMALNPNPAIWAIPASRLICHRPCGAQFDVSMPNQFTALIRNGLFCASRICDPEVCSFVMIEDVVD